MNNGWKQPIPTFCLEWSPITRAIFVEVLLRARNKKEVIPTFWHGNKCYTDIELERGECIFVISRYAEATGWSPRKIRGELKRLIKMNIIMQINRKSFGLVISVKNYDDLVRFANQNANQSANQSQINRRTSNKSVKSVKSEENKKKVSKEKVSKPIKGKNTSNTKKATGKTKKKKEKTYNVNGEERTLGEMATAVMNYWNKVRDNKYTSIRAWKDNLAYWLEEYTIEDIFEAIANVKYDEWWDNKMAPDMMFRQMNQNREKVDRIAKFKNINKYQRG